MRKDFFVVCSASSRRRDLASSAREPIIDSAQAGDIDTVVELMGTLLSLEGAYESEAGEDESPPGPCAD